MRMSAATSPSDPPPPSANGAGKADGALRVVADGGLRLRRQRAPLRLLRPRAGPGEPPLGVVANLSGGVLGGDRLAVEVEAASGALLTGQAAEKIYRSAGPCARMRAAATVRAGGALEWLPQGAIVFDRARLDRRTVVRVAPGGRCLAGEMLVFGRAGMGETADRAEVFEGWRVERGGRARWIDTLRLGGAGGASAGARLAAPYGFAGARCLATAIYAGDDAPGLLELARDAARPRGAGRAVRAAATAVGGILIVRWLGRDAASARAAFGSFWSAFRAAALGRPPRLPALWTA